jgi:hypothetical protein
MYQSLVMYVAMYAPTENVNNPYARSRRASTEGAEQAEHQPPCQRRRAGQRQRSTVRTAEYEQRRPESHKHPLHGGDAGAVVH